MARFKKKVDASLGEDIALENEECMTEDEFVKLFEEIDVTPITPNPGARQSKPKARISQVQPDQESAAGGQSRSA